jgi:hypothetical protein
VVAPVAFSGAMSQFFALRFRANWRRVLIAKFTKRSEGCHMNTLTWVIVVALAAIGLLVVVSAV